MSSEATSRTTLDLKRHNYTDAMLHYTLLERNPIYTWVGEHHVLRITTCFEEQIS